MLSAQAALSFPRPYSELDIVNADQQGSNKWICKGATVRDIELTFGVPAPHGQRHLRVQPALIC